MKLTLDGQELHEGKFVLWKVATQANTGVDLHSVYFVTEDDKFYEVVFTKPGDGNVANGWYLVEKKVKQEQPKTKKAEPIEGEIVDPSNPPDLSVQVEDEMDVKAIFG